MQGDAGGIIRPDLLNDDPKALFPGPAERQLHGLFAISVLPVRFVDRRAYADRALRMLIQADLADDLTSTEDREHLEIPAVILHLVPLLQHIPNFLLCHVRIDLLQSRNILRYKMTQADHSVYLNLSIEEAIFLIICVATPCR